MEINHIRIHKVKILINNIDFDRLKNPCAVGLFAFLAIIQTYIFYLRYCSLSDWSITFYLAAHNLFSSNLYSLKSYGYFYPPLPLIFIFPFTFLDIRLSNAIISTLCLVTIWIVAYKRGAKPLALAIFMVVPQLQFMAGNGDFIDALTAVGFILPPQIGLFFVLSKPQAGAAVAIFWLAEAWRRGKFREVFKIFTPVSISYILTLLLYSPNLFEALKSAPGIVGLNAYHNATLWPYGIIIGIPLLINAIRKHNIGPAILSSACFSPYIGFYSWPIALLGLLPDQTMFSLASLAMWIPAFIKGHY